MRYQTELGDAVNAACRNLKLIKTSTGMSAKRNETAKQKSENEFSTIKITTFINLPNNEAAAYICQWLTIGQNVLVCL